MGFPHKRRISAKLHDRNVRKHANNKTVKAIHPSAQSMGEGSVSQLYELLRSHTDVGSIIYSFIGVTEIYHVRDALVFSKTLPIAPFRLILSHESDKDWRYKNEEGFSSAIAYVLRCSLKLISLEAVGLLNVELENFKVIAESLIQCNASSLDLSGIRNPAADDFIWWISRSLAENKYLRSLDLTGCDITKYGLKWISEYLIKGNNFLLDLNLVGNNIRATAVKPLADALNQNRTLKRLDLGYNNIGNTGSRFIAHSLLVNTQLIVLNLSCNNIGDEGMMHLKYGLIKNQYLQQLDLSNNKLCYSGAFHISGVLKHNSSLKDLLIQSNNIGFRGALMIADALESNQTLRQLSLEQNGIGNSGAMAILIALRTNRSIQQLHIGWNSIYDTSVFEELSETLATNAILKELTINGNQVKDKGAAIIATGLEANETLKTLEMTHAGIGDEGIRAIAASIKALNSSLKRLNLLGNMFGTHGFNYLREVLSSNQSLHELDIRMNNVGSKDIESLVNLKSSCMHIRRL